MAFVTPPIAGKEPLRVYVDAMRHVGTYLCLCTHNIRYPSRLIIVLLASYYLSHHELVIGNK